MTHPPEIKNFVAMGRFLHGEKWKSAIARDLNFSLSYINMMIHENPENRKPISQKTHHKMIELVAKKLSIFEWDLYTDLEIRLKMKELE